MLSEITDLQDGVRRGDWQSPLFDGVPRAPEADCQAAADLTICPTRSAVVDKEADLGGPQVLFREAVGRNVILLPCRRGHRGCILAAILRGSVYWADIDPVRGREQAGLRPVLILSNDLCNRNSGTVIAMAITSQAPHARVDFLSWWLSISVTHRFRIDVLAYAHLRARQSQEEACAAPGFRFHPHVAALFQYGLSRQR